MSNIVAFWYVYRDGQAYLTDSILVCCWSHFTLTVILTTHGLICHLFILLFFVLHIPLVFKV
jgi:hypothetical protein